MLVSGRVVFFFFVAQIWAEVCEHRWEGIGGLVNFRQARQFLKNGSSHQLQILVLGIKETQSCRENHKLNPERGSLIKKSEIHLVFNGMLSKGHDDTRQFGVRHVVDYPSPRSGLHKMVTLTRGIDIGWWQVVFLCGCFRK